MEVGITELVKHVTKLVERAEHGEAVLITRHGKAVAKLTRVGSRRKRPKLGTMGKVDLLPGWDKDQPLDLWDVHRDESAPKSKQRAKRNSA